MAYQCRALVDIQFKKTKVRLIAIRLYEQSSTVKGLVF